MKKIVKDCVEDYMMTCQEEYQYPGKIIIKLVRNQNFLYLCKKDCYTK